MSHHNKNNAVAIIGAGFSGIMTAVHLMREATAPLTIYLINSKPTFGKGAAYSTDSSKHLLNVITAKMGAFADNPGNFLEWVQQQPGYIGVNKDALGKAFLPRKLYGRYIESVWQNALADKPENVTVHTIHDAAVDMDQNQQGYTIYLRDHAPIHAGQVILATGNEAPCNPVIPNEKFYQSESYVKNPWLTDVTRMIKPGKDILIIGNGLTTVDQVISIMESGYKGTIHTLSPRGFSIMPHRFSHVEYKDFVNEISEPYTYNDLFKSGLKHFRKLYRMGISAEPIVDSLRPFTQKIWQALSVDDKRTFLHKFRPTWNTIRHRLAPHLYDFVQSLRLKGRVIVHKGSLINISEDATGVTMQYLSRNTHAKKEVHVGLVINCTGPHTDVSKSENPLISVLVAKGMIRPDELRIGMDVTKHWTLIDSRGEENPTLYTIGGNLRGLLWETTAIPELRGQAAKLAHHILDTVKAVQIPVTVSR